MLWFRTFKNSQLQLVSCQRMCSYGRHQESSLQSRWLYLERKGVRWCQVQLELRQRLELPRSRFISLPIKAIKIHLWCRCKGTNKQDSKIRKKRSNISPDRILTSNQRFQQTHRILCNKTSKPKRRNIWCLLQDQVQLKWSCHFRRMQSSWVMVRINKSPKEKRWKKEIIA